MAEQAAHFAATFQAKPSIFEVIAQHSLNETLHPAFERLIRVNIFIFFLSLIELFFFNSQFLASVRPRYFEWLNRNYDEVFLILNAALQNHYLKNHGSMFEIIIR